MNLIKKIFKSRLSLVFIVLVWFIFSSPFFVSHKVPFPSTYLVNFFSPWSDYPGFASPVKNNAMSDVISQIYPWKNLTIEAFKNFQMPLWNQYSFSGTPSLANYQSAVLSPFNILFFLFKFIDAWSLLILLQPLLAGIFMYFCLSSFGITKKSLVLGSISFMFCGFITSWMAYGTLAFAILFLPLAIYSVEMFYKTQNSRFLILLAFTFPLSFFSGHFQISLYFLLTVFLFILYKYISVRNINYLHMTLLYTGIGMFLSLPQLLPSIELYKQSLRSGIFQKLETIPWGYLPTLISPDFYGNPVTRNDWFGHYAEWNGYLGLIPLMLAFYAFFRNTKKIIWFFVVLAVLSILLSFPSPFLDFIIWLKIPVLSTSAASRAIVLFSFAGSVLAAFGLDKFLQDFDLKKLKNIFIWISFFGIIFLGLWLVILLKLFMPIDKILIAKQNLILPSLVFVIFVSLVFVFWLLKKKIKSERLSHVLIVSIILITAFDLLRFSGKWMPFENKDLVYPNVPVVAEFNKISKDGRVFGNIGGEATTTYKLESVEGYDAVYIKRYGEFIASLSHGKLEQSPRSLVLFPEYGVNTKKALNLLNIKYLVYKVGDGRASWTFPFWTYKTGIFTLLYNDGVYQVLQNNDAYERAYLVGSYAVEKDSQKILDKMFSNNFDLRKGVVLEKNLNTKLNLGKGSAKIVSYSSGKVVINTKSDGNALLFLSDTYYPGWQAKIDGKESEIFRADYTFRAVSVGKGNHTVEFIYNPLSFKVGVLGALFGIVCILLLEALRRRKIILFPKT